jgi:chromosome segregation ATPase
VPPARTVVSSLLTDPSIEKKLELLQAEVVFLKGNLEKHTETLTQRVGNLSASFQAVCNNIQKGQTQQDTLFRTVKEIDQGQKNTEKRVGHTHDLVSNIWSRNKQVDNLADTNRSLETALQEMNLERRASKSLLTDSQAQAEQLRQERDHYAQQVEQLKSQVRALHIELSKQKCLESLKSEHARDPPQAGCSYDAGIGYSIKKKR